MTTLVKKDRTKLLESLSEYLSEETGFLHVAPASLPAKRSDAVSISLNFLYLLFLFRTKERERVEWAIEKLDQLLYFQSTQEESLGNFPVFMHEYPNCHRYFEVIDSLFPLYWIVKEFSALLSSNLKGRLHAALLNGLKCIDRLDEGREYSYLLSLQRAALMLGIGQLLDEQKWIGKGQESLIKQAERGPQACWGSPRALSKIMISLELCPDQQDSWKTFWSYIHQTWASEMPGYNGPALFEYYDQDRQEGTLYHLYMERVTKESQTLRYGSLTLLEGELIQNTAAYQKVNLPQIESLDMYSFNSTSNPAYAVSYFNLDQELWEKTGGYYPFKLLMKNRELVDSFVLQMGSHTQIKTLEEGKWLFTFAPTEELDACFFINLSSKVEALIQGKRATTFRLDQPLTLQFETHKLTLSFPNPSEEIWGQLMQTNRRSQIQHENNQTHDLHLYFRQIKQQVRPMEVLIEITN